MDDREDLAARFEASRQHLTAVAYRMLGSHADAQDAVQEAWLRLQRTDADPIGNLTGWLTTVVARVCLDALRSRASRREEPLVESPSDPGDPEEAAATADAVGLALLVVLDALEPAERLAFVLHDMFAVPFEQIAPIVGRTPEAARQLASRGRRRVRGAGAPEGDLTRQRQVVRAFLAASREGDFEALLHMLDPDAVVRSDATATAAGSDASRQGARSVAQMFAGRAQEARLALLGGAVGAVWAPGGAPRVAFAFTVVGDRIARIDVVADPDRIRALDPVVLPEFT